MVYNTALLSYQLHETHGGILRVTEASQVVTARLHILHQC